MIRRVAGDLDWQVTELAYNKQGELQYLTDKTWTTDGAGEVLNETIENIQEFRGSGRARYLARQWDTQSLSPDFDSALWTDYDGDTPYADYTVDELGSVTVTKIYEPGLGQIDQLTGEVTYLHSDHLGTTRLVTDSLGQPQGQATFTAFGEKIDDSLDTRYEYVGSYGYESFSELTSSVSPLTSRLQHVGHRTYDPATGRFLERDPIGILGGLNVYEYVSSNSISYTDQTGLWNDEGWERYYQRRDRMTPEERRQNDIGMMCVAGAGIAVNLLYLFPGLIPALLPHVPLPPPKPQLPPVLPGMPGPGPDPSDLEEPPPVRPSIPDDLPPGPLPPLNPDDYWPLYRPPWSPGPGAFL
ncbi:MAG: hypothetical protein HJJLKODD_01366 [Phycisphaerae bacterium]|nr:hypothetical protein [Phycisphaerae bacterium]